MKYLSNGEKDTLKLGREFAKTLCGGETIALVGDLGAGKTHFCKGIAKGLNIKEPVTSPTFTLHNIYHGKLTLNHFDFYRLGETEGDSLGFEEIIGDKSGVAVIEWPFNCQKLIPPSYVKVTIVSLGGDIRQIEIENI